MSDKNYLKLIDFSAIVAVLTAACYLIGHSYFSSYFMVFGLSPSDVDIEFRDYIVFAFSPLIMVVTVCLIFWNEGGIVTKFKRMEAASSWLILSSFFYSLIAFGHGREVVLNNVAFGVICILLIAIGALSKITLKQAVQSRSVHIRIIMIPVFIICIIGSACILGGRAGKKLLGDSKNATQVCTVTASPDSCVVYPNELIYVGQGKGFIFFVQRCEGDEPKVKTTYRIPISTVVSIEQHNQKPTAQNTKKIAPVAFLDSKIDVLKEQKAESEKNGLGCSEPDRSKSQR